MDRIELWWELAGPAGLLDRIARAVARGDRVACLSVPDPRPQGLADALERRLRSELSMNCSKLDLSGRDQSQPIPHLLAEMLDVPISDIGTVSDLASHSALSDQVVVVDGLDTTQILRWGVFVRAMAAEKVTAVVGPVFVLLMPCGIGEDQKRSLCGSLSPISSRGLVDRYDSVAYLARLGIRPGTDLVARVGHAVAIDVAAWSRDVLDIMASWDPSEQADPMGSLEAAARAVGDIRPTWDNGLIDYWDDEPVVHAVAAVANRLHGQVRHRIWCGQASVLLPFTYRVLRAFIGRYRELLDREVSPEKPYVKAFASGKQFVVTDPERLEFYDVQTFAKDVMPKAEKDLMTIAGWVRNAVAHRDIVPPEEIAKLSDHYEANRGVIVRGE